LTKSTTPGLFADRALKKEGSKNQYEIKQAIFIEQASGGGESHQKLGLKRHVDLKRNERGNRHPEEEKTDKNLPEKNSGRYPRGGDAID